MGHVNGLLNNMNMPDVGPGPGSLLRMRRSAPEYEPEEDYDHDDDDEDDYDEDHAGDEDYPSQPFFGKFPRGLRVL